MNGRGVDVKREATGVGLEESGLAKAGVHVYQYIRRN